MTEHQINTITAKLLLLEDRLVSMRESLETIRKEFTRARAGYTSQTVDMMKLFCTNARSLLLSAQDLDRMVRKALGEDE